MTTYKRFRKLAVGVLLLCVSTLFPFVGLSCSSVGPSGNSKEDLHTLVRQEVAEGRIAFKLTTPEEFKTLVGPPAKESTEANGEIILLEYPDIRARFFGKPQIKTPHTIIEVSCAGRYIDIGQDRPIVLRHEGDIPKLGSFWGFSEVDLSRLDLSQQGGLLDRTTLDSLTVWPPADRLPPGFDPVKRLEWGKTPGLGVRSLHREGITGKGVGIAIIDQPLLKDHVEYADRIKSYTFDSRGGNSWTVPYLAGLAAMAFQIHPQISPERIVTLFQETATQTK